MQRWLSACGLSYIWSLAPTSKSTISFKNPWSTTEPIQYTCYTSHWCDVISKGKPELLQYFSKVEANMSASYQMAESMMLKASICTILVSATLLRNCSTSVFMTFFCVSWFITWKAALKSILISVLINNVYCEYCDHGAVYVLSVVLRVPRDFCQLTMTAKSTFNLFCESVYLRDRGEFILVQCFTKNTGYGSCF